MGYLAAIPPAQPSEAKDLQHFAEGLCFSVPGCCRLADWPGGKLVQRQAKASYLAGMNDPAQGYAQGEAKKRFSILLNQSQLIVENLDTLPTKR